MPNEITINQIAGPIEASLKNTDDVGDIDLSTLTAFGGLGSPGEADVVIELIDLYLKDGAERVLQLKHAEVTGDQILLKKAAHTLKGSSGSLGFNRMLELCEELEQMKVSDDIKAVIKILQFEFARVCAALVVLRQSRISSAQKS